MRPVEKLYHPESVSYLDSNNQVIIHQIQTHYNHYREAKAPLVANIGQTCSYCEDAPAMAVLEVEHMYPKGKGGDLTAWDNFLLCCKECNTLKGSTIPGKSYHWPHINNTFLDYLYDETGRIKINPKIPPKSQTNAQNLLDLLKLQNYPTINKPSECDFRWKQRYETWKTASIQLKSYKAKAIDIEEVITVAKTSRNWSIWFTVFSEEDEVLHRLITDFPGTCSSCFDATNHYAPIYRNPGNAEDPV